MWWKKTVYPSGGDVATRAINDKGDVVGLSLDLNPVADYLKVTGDFIQYDNRAAIALCRPHGSFVWQGNYGAAPVSLHFLPPHGKRLRMFFPCDDGLEPCRRAVVKNMAMGALRWERCITHRIDAAGAPEMYRRIEAGADKDVVGVLIGWPD